MAARWFGCTMRIPSFDKGIYPLYTRYADRRQSAENVVSGNDGYHEKMDGPPAEIGAEPENRFCPFVAIYKILYQFFEFAQNLKWS